MTTASSAVRAPDTLTGGADNDTFVFDTAPNAVKSITDFDASEAAASEDFIELSSAVFAGIGAGPGTLGSADFASVDGGGASVTFGMGTSVNIIYDSATGNLYYDADATNAADRTLFAKLTLSDPVDTFDYNDIKVGP